MVKGALSVDCPTEAPIQQNVTPEGMPFFKKIVVIGRIQLSYLLEIIFRL
jgi:hypothetical protein